MKQFLLAFSLILTHICMAGQTTNEIPLTELEGKWYINMSNLKMWLKGNKHDPTFNYTIKIKGDIKGLKDDVAYHKNNKQKHIIGFDKPVDNTNTKFVWRGKGLLILVKSKWEILFVADNYTIIHFEKTLFTAEGYDVISRTKILDAATIEKVKAKLAELGIKNDLQIIPQH
jgi:lipocalin